MKFSTACGVLVSMGQCAGMLVLKYTCIMLCKLQKRALIVPESHQAALPANTVGMLSTLTPTPTLYIVPPYRPPVVAPHNTIASVSCCPCWSLIRTSCCPAPVQNRRQMLITPRTSAADCESLMRAAMSDCSVGSMALRSQQGATSGVPSLPSNNGTLRGTASAENSAENAAAAAAAGPSQQQQQAGRLQQQGRGSVSRPGRRPASSQPCDTSAAVSTEASEIQADYSKVTDAITSVCCHCWGAAHVELL